MMNPLYKTLSFSKIIFEKYFSYINYFSTMVLFILFESSIGYGLFELKEFDEVNSSVDKVQKEIKTFETFSKIAQLKVHPSTPRLSTPSSHPQLPLESSVAHSQERLHKSLSISSERTSPQRKNPKRNWE